MRRPTASSGDKTKCQNCQDRKASQCRDGRAEVRCRFDVPSLVARHRYEVPQAIVIKTGIVEVVVDPYELALGDTGHPLSSGVISLRYSTDGPHFLDRKGWEGLRINARSVS